MKRQSYTSRQSLFLMELILAIFFFVVASAICVQIFAKAHLMSRHTHATQIAVEQASNAAEIIRSNPTHAQEALVKYLPTATTTDNTLTVHLGDDGAPVEDEGAPYTMVLTLSPSKTTMTADITVTQKDGATPLYTLQVKKHLAQGGV